MIFDSPKFTRLRERFSTAPSYIWPYILYLGNKPEYEDEKKDLEEAIRHAPPKVQNDWLGRLISDDDDQFMGAWFEMMLCNWLSGTGEIEVGPEIMGSQPDFLIRRPNEEIVIEAKAILLSTSERNNEKWKNAFFSVLENIQLPYYIIVRDAKLNGYPEAKELASEIENWLLIHPEEKLCYKDRSDTILILESEYQPTRNNLAVFWSGGAEWINPDALKPALKEKSKAHKLIREAGYPYIIALFIEPILFSLEEVIDAWFGNITATIDVNQQKVIEVRRDNRGLHLYRKELSHRSISGTLVFKTTDKSGFAGRILKGWFIENPYAKVKVNSEIFPVEDRLIITEQDSNGFWMKWKKRSDFSK